MTLPALPPEEQLVPRRSTETDPGNTGPTDWDPPTPFFEGMTDEPVFDDGQDIVIDDADD